MAFSNLFTKSTVRFAIDLELNRYVYATCGNWDNHEPDTDVITGNKENKKNDDELENMKKSLNNLYTLYDVYN